jgi:hypothetical protein
MIRKDSRDRAAFLPMLRTASSHTHLSAGEYGFQQEENRWATMARAKALQAQALKHLGEAGKAAALSSETQAYVDELEPDQWRERLELELLLTQANADEPAR